MAKRLCNLVVKLSPQRAPGVSQGPRDRTVWLPPQSGGLKFLSGQTALTASSPPFGGRRPPALWLHAWAAAGGVSHAPWSPRALSGGALTRVPPLLAAQLQESALASHEAHGEGEAQGPGGGDWCQHWPRSWRQARGPFLGHCQLPQRAVESTPPGDSLSSPPPPAAAQAPSGLPEDMPIFRLRASPLLLMPRHLREGRACRWSTASPPPCPETPAGLPWPLGRPSHCPGVSPSALSPIPALASVHTAGARRVAAL